MLKPEEFHFSFSPLPVFFPTLSLYPLSLSPYLISLCVSVLVCLYMIVSYAFHVVFIALLDLGHIALPLPCLPAILIPLSRSILPHLARSSPILPLAFDPRPSLHDGQSASEDYRAVGGLD